jgi:hypothetical protein
MMPYNSQVLPSWLGVILIINQSKDGRLPFAGMLYRWHRIDHWILKVVFLVMES